MTAYETNILTMMKKLGINREEAIELLNYDDAVNSGKKTEYDLTPEQEQNVKEMARKVGHKKYGPVKRERKPDELKEAIVAELAEFLREDALGQAYEDVEIANVNRMIHFKVGETEFDLQLIKKTKKTT